MYVLVSCRVSQVEFGLIGLLATSADAYLLICMQQISHLRDHVKTAILVNKCNDVSYFNYITASGTVNDDFT